MAVNNYFNATPVSIEFNAVKQVDSKPAASGFDDGNIIFDKTEQQFYQALSGSWIALDFIGDDFTVNKLAFNTAATETLATGELAWNTDDETVDMHVGDDVTIQLGQEMVYHVINQTGTQIDNGTVVMADGALGASGKIKVVPAIADGSVPAKYIMGVATEDIPNGALGYVTAFGKVRGFNTSSYSSGTVLYASATSSGSLTDTVPASPNAKVTIAITLDQKNNGTIFVRPTYGSSFSENQDVTITSASGGQILEYSGSSSVWENVVHPPKVTSISNLENLPAGKYNSVYLDAGGRSGWFKWDDTDHSVATGTGFVDDDTGQGIYVAPSSDATGASGAWVRVRDNTTSHFVTWFGATGDGTTDDTTAFSNAFSFASPGDTIVVPTPDTAYIVNGATLPLRVSLVSDGYTRKYVVGNSSDINGLPVIRKTSGTEVIRFSGEQEVRGLIFDGVDGTGYGLGDSSGCNNIYVVQCSFIRFSVGIGINGYTTNSRFLLVHAQNNSRGMRNFVDSHITNCEINDNTIGIDQQAGANDCMWVNNKVEFNDEENWRFTNSVRNTVIGGICDRSGDAGMRIVDSDINISGVVMRRNGRNSLGTNECAHFYLDGSSCKVNISNVDTSTGADDGGGGDVTPNYTFSLRGSKIDTLTITGGDATGCVTTPYTAFNTPTNVKIIGVLGVEDLSNNGLDRISDGRRFIASINTGEISASSTSTATITQGSLNTFERSQRSVSVSARDATVAASALGELKVLFIRESGSASAQIYRLATFTSRDVGTSGSDDLQFAITSTSSDASTFDIAVTNNSTSVWQVFYTVT